MDKETYIVNDTKQENDVERENGVDGENVFFLVSSFLSFGLWDYFFHI